MPVLVYRITARCRGILREKECGCKELYESAINEKSTIPGRAAIASFLGIFAERDRIVGDDSIKSD